MGYYVDGCGTIKFSEAPPKDEVERAIRAWSDFAWDDERTLWLSIGDKIAGCEEDLLDVIDKFSVADIDIKMAGEDGYHWRWYLDGDELAEEGGEVVYDGDQNPSYKRLRDILVAYVDNDYEEWAPGEGRQYVYKKLRNAVNCTDEEIEALGLGFLIPEEE